MFRKYIAVFFKLMLEIRMSEKLTYKTNGTCSKSIDLMIKDNLVESVKFSGGCPGNLLGITELIRGMDVHAIINKLEGVTCGRKNTSCPDQLAKALRRYIEDSKN